MNIDELYFCESDFAKLKVAYKELKEKYDQSQLNLAFVRNMKFDANIELKAQADKLVDALEYVDHIEEFPLSTVSDALKEWYKYKGEK